MTETIAKPNKKRGRPPKTKPVDVETKVEVKTDVVAESTPEVIDKTTIYYQISVGSNQAGSQVPYHLEDRSYDISEIVNYAKQLKEAGRPIVFNIDLQNKRMEMQNESNYVTRELGLRKDPEQVKRAMRKVAYAEEVDANFDIGTEEGACRLAEHFHNIRSGKVKNQAAHFHERMVQGVDNGNIII